MGCLCRCAGIVLEPIRKRLHTQLVREHNRPQSFQLAELLWTDPGLKNGISVRELISTLKKKEAKLRRGLIVPTFSQSPRKHGKSHHHHHHHHCILRLKRCLCFEYRYYNKSQAGMKCIGATSLLLCKGSDIDPTPFQVTWRGEVPSYRPIET